MSLRKLIGKTRSCLSAYRDRRGHRLRLQPQSSEVAFKPVIGEDYSIEQLTRIAWELPSDLYVQRWVLTEQVRVRLTSASLAIEPEHVERALAAMGRVHRERFVPQGYENLAYLPMSGDIGHGQTISKPDVVAAMTAAIAADDQAIVLEVGTGSGYQAAILGEIARQVVSFEIIPDLARSAALRLKTLGYDNVEVVEGDGSILCRDQGPFDAILVAAGSDVVPPALLDRLAIGGRLVMPIGPTKEREELILVRRLSDGLKYASLGRVRFVPLTGPSGRSHLEQS